MKGLTPKGAKQEHTWTHRAVIRRALPSRHRAHNGYCFGAGMELAASCDMRVGVTTAKFGMPEVRFGIPSGMEACLLPQLIGWGKTRELVYTGDPIDATEAHRCGFLEKSVEPAELDSGVEQWVASILAAGPRAIRLQKKLVRNWERMTITKRCRRASGPASKRARPTSPEGSWPPFSIARKTGRRDLVNRDMVVRDMMRRDMVKRGLLYLRRTNYHVTAVPRHASSVT